MKEELKNKYGKKINVTTMETCRSTYFDIQFQDTNAEFLKEMMCQKM